MLVAYHRRVFCTEYSSTHPGPTPVKVKLKEYSVILTTSFYGINQKI